VAGAVRHVLVDTSTDLRAQALAHDVRRVDAILFTHGHADHVFGIDEVRRFNHLQRSPIPIMASPGALADIRQTFAYIFNAPPAYGGGVPKLVPFAIGSETSGSILTPSAFCGVKAGIATVATTSAAASNAFFNMIDLL
jgi:phosphoribosyl 1,2-cyclic phosphodiesterase